MAARFEHIDASLADIVGPGEQLGDLIIDAYALVIGDPWDCAAVIEGPLEHVESQLEALLRAVRSTKNHRDRHPVAPGA